MQVTAEEEIANLLGSCLPELEAIEAAFVRDCWLREPKSAAHRIFTTAAFVRQGVDRSSQPGAGADEEIVGDERR